MMKDKTITLCGSTKFKDTFMKVAKALTLKGYIVLMPHVFVHADNIELTITQKKALDTLHRVKIDISGNIYVIDVGGYIGHSTKSEIYYAKATLKCIYYYSTGELIS